MNHDHNFSCDQNMQLIIIQKITKDVLVFFRIDVLVQYFKVDFNKYPFQAARFGAMSLCNIWPNQVPSIYTLYMYLFDRR